MASYRFIPMYPAKYAGDPKRIFARSKWEFNYMGLIDKSPVVLRWLSEPKQLNISYVDPVDRQVKQYWPDFLIQYKDGSKELVELKPLRQAKFNPNDVYDKIMFARNVAKWEAASRFCKRNNVKFRVVTEKQLNTKKRKQARKKK